MLCDVKELQRGMELTWREFSVQHNSTLKDFISRNETRLNKLQEDARIAKVMLHVLRLSTDNAAERSTFSPEVWCKHNVLFFLVLGCV